MNCLEERPYFITVRSEANYAVKSGKVNSVFSMNHIQNIEQNISPYAYAL